MVAVSVRYKFSQKFAVPVDDAFAWAVDYDPDDYALMGLEGERKIKKLSDDAFILEDTRPTQKGPVTKSRLVRLDRGRRILINTHIDSPTPPLSSGTSSTPSPAEARGLTSQVSCSFSGRSLCPTPRSQRSPPRRGRATR